MAVISFEQFADHLEEITIIQTIDDGFAHLYYGIESSAMYKFLVNDAYVMSSIMSI